MKKILTLMLSLVFALGASACGSPKEEGTLEVLYCNTLQPMAAADTEIMKIPEKQANLLGGIYKSAYKHSKHIITKMNEKGVSLKYSDWGWGEPLSNKQGLALRDGNGPDLFMGEGQMVEFAANGALLPFPDDLADYVRANFYEGAYKSCEFDGKIYGVSPSFVPSMLIVNAELADKIWPEGYVAPATWADWLQQMEEVNTWNASPANNTGKSVKPGGPFFGVNAGSYLRTYNFFSQQEVELFDSATKAPTFTGDGVKDTLQFFRDIQNKNGGTFGTSADSVNASFIANELVFKIDGAGSKSYHETLTPPQDVYVVPVPTPTAEGSEAGILIATVFYGVPRYVKGDTKDAAFDYIRFMLDDEALTPIRDSRFKCVPKKSLITDEWIASQPEEYRQILTDMYRLVDSDKMLSLPSFPYQNGKCWDEVGKAIKSATTTSGSLDTIMNSAQTQLTRYYNNK